MKAEITLEYIRENGLILLEAISGSRAYGTSTPESDTDYRGVFILPEDHILGTKYTEQVSDSTNDTTFYELKRFLQLVEQNNPNILELLNVPDDCIIYKHPSFDHILEHRDKFITKLCKNSIGGYARQQISKAGGLNKKQNWEKDKVTRKDILDFCYIIEGNTTRPIKDWFQLHGYVSDAQVFCGVVNVPNARDTYTLYYDGLSSNCFSSDYNNVERQKLIDFQINTASKLGLGYKGIMKTDENSSNQLRLSSIPKDEKPIAIFSYNQDGYSQHCKDFREYEDWLTKRNTARYTDVKSHGQGLDGKNLMHCKRLLEMAREIGSGQGINVRRPNAEALLDIRRGKVSLPDLVIWAENEIKAIDEIFDNSDLPSEVDSKLLDKLCVKVRREFYNGRP